MAPTRPPPDELLYPSEDPAPAASNWHNKQVHLLVDALQRHFAARADAFVGSNIDLLYYDDNGESVRVAPDVLVALGVAPASERERDSYQVWKEGVPPAVIIEIADGARWGDVLSNAEPYATMGVVEYYLFDPNAAPPTARLEGCHCITGGQYLPMAGPALKSPALGLELVTVDEWLRLRDPGTGRLLPTSLELAQELAAAEAEIARLRAELAGRQRNGR